MKLRDMLKVILVIALLVFVLVPNLLAVTPARQVVTNTLGAVAVTNNDDYVVKKLVSVQFTGMQPADTTATLTRVSGGATSTLATVVGTSGGGIRRETNAVYQFKADELRITGAGTNTGSRAEIIWENYP